MMVVLVAIIVGIEGRCQNSIPANKMLCFMSQLNVIREVKCFLPVDDLLIGFCCSFRTERWPSN